MRFHVSLSALVGFFAHHDDADLLEIQDARERVMASDLSPSVVHILAPSDVIEDYKPRRDNVGLYLIEVLDRSRAVVMTVDEDQIKGPVFLEA